MNLLKHTCCLATALLFFSCTTQKVVLDPVTVKANHPEAKIYRGSYPKLTDILHTKLDLKFNFDSSLVIGKAWIDARPYFYESDSLILNAKGFKISQVALVKPDERRPLPYKYDGRTLRIKLDKAYSRGEKYKVYIQYVSMPSMLQIGNDILSPGGRGFYFINPTGKEADKPRQFWTQGEPESNSAWFPTIDGPQEKMTQEISLTVPTGMVTLSNGSFDFSTENGDGTRTDFWRMEKPHSTYLTMVAAGDFSIVKDHWEDKEVSYYVEPEFEKYARMIFGKTPEMIGFFSKKLGVEYPWEKYSQIVVRDFNDGAMENTTATVFFERMNMTDAEYKDETYEDIISHELFHHWFGDLVTAESWANLPLNESFATYGEYLWNEHKYGRDFADYNGWKDLKAYLKSDKDHLDVIRYDYADPDQMFDQVSYQKGGRILHMLRKTVGDEAFFKALNVYLKKNAYQTAELADLRLAFEEVTGLDLNWFFNQWFLSSGHPVLAIETDFDPESKKVSLTIRQTQNAANTPVYRLPMAVDLYIDGKVLRREIVLNKQNQTFSFDVPGAPDLVNVDAEKYLLAEKQEKKTTQQYVFQYQHAPLFADRMEAIAALSKLPQEKIAREVWIAALKDQNWEIRLQALKLLPQLTEEEKNTVYPQLKEMAIEDQRSYVRAAVLGVLNKSFGNRDNKAVFSKAASDNAPSVQKALGEITR